MQSAPVNFRSLPPAVPETSLTLNTFPTAVASRISCAIDDRSGWRILTNQPSLEPLERNVGHLAHTDERNAVSGCGADCAVGANELRFAFSGSTALRRGAERLRETTTMRCRRDRSRRRCRGQRICDSQGKWPQRPPNGGLTNTSPSQRWRNPSSTVVKILCAFAK